MQVSSESYGQLQAVHLCTDGFKWIITEKDQEEMPQDHYHGFLFAPSGAILAHFHHKNYIPLESQLRGMLSYYRAKDYFTDQTLIGA